MSKKNIKIFSWRTKDGEGKPTADQDISDNNIWINDNYEEGHLSLDVYETDKDIIIKAPVAGANVDDLDISVNNDMLTIRGERKAKIHKKGEYIYQECFWGPFSRSVILPSEIDIRRINASLENGILTITLKKVAPSDNIEIKVK